MLEGHWEKTTRQQEPFWWQPQKLHNNFLKEVRLIVDLQKAAEDKFYLGLLLIDLVFYGQA